MEKKLSWFDRVITPKTKAYRDFEKEIKNTVPEIFFRDGERKFSDQEKKFLQIYKSKESQMYQGSAYTVNSIFNSNSKALIKTNFKSFGEVVRFVDKQRTDDRFLIVQDNTAFVEVPISDEVSKQKFLSDSWAKEFQSRTDLSSGLDYRQIEEQMIYHYHKYEMAENKINIEINPFKEESNESRKGTHQLDWEENNLGFEDLFSQDDFNENLVSASGLPEGWCWREYDDGSGSLKSPTGNSYYGYDLQTQEYRSSSVGNRWTDMKDLYERSKSLNEFKTYAENDLKGKAAQNNIFPELSEDEKNNLLDYRRLNKENEFILEKLHISDNQRKSFSENVEYGTTDGDYSLTEEQLDKIPDVIDGHLLSKNDKSELAFGLLEKKENGESYKLLSNGEILKTYLDEESLPEYRILTVNDIKFNNQNPHIMETQQDFNQVKYLKDQMKYLGFGEDEKLHKDLEKGINSKKQEFEIKTTSDKTLPKNKIDFVLKFNKTENGGVFFNSYNAKLINEKNEELSHNFSVSKNSSFTAKEAINLLEGRSVKIEFYNPKKNNEIEPAFVQFNFNEPKTDKGNYLFQNFYKNYGVDTAKIVEKSNLVFDKPEWKGSAIKSLEKGNILKVKFKENDQVIEGKAVLDPQNRNLKLYDNEMNRLNTNKPLEGLEQDNKHEKANVREQSIKR
ncbi:hypothetical protein MKS83_19495 [Chryseobacterium sp. Y16C]|uniref:hypothetical protein n=1 Tax=Chryseobacterium sp. Y16C TaxID=2920939 RepID=UPI001F0B2EFA|nr:hypothetical protein [Chryseobacterium sp. Y16C]UMQ41557.1 hypothetical protein MKS83_19495 [Chryseobacterium sp. Y16C]